MNVCSHRYQARNLLMYTPLVVIWQRYLLFDSSICDLLPGDLLWFFFVNSVFIYLFFIYLGVKKLFINRYRLLCFHVIKPCNTIFQIWYYFVRVMMWSKRSWDPDRLKKFYTKIRKKNCVSISLNQKWCDVMRVCVCVFFFEVLNLMQALSWRLLRCAHWSWSLRDPKVLTIWTLL